jgi:hypothetical protein
MQWSFEVFPVSNFNRNMRLTNHLSLSTLLCIYMSIYNYLYLYYWDYRHSLTKAVSDKLFQRHLKNEIAFLKRALNFSLWEWKCKETKVAEEYCWAITQAAERYCCGRSGSSESEFGCQLDSLVCTHTVDHMCTRFRLAPDLPERNCRVVREVCVFRPDKLAQPVTLLLSSIWEVSDSNLSRDTDYLDRFFMIFLILTGKIEPRFGYNRFLPHLTQFITFKSLSHLKPIVWDTDSAVE